MDISQLFEGKDFASVYKPTKSLAQKTGYNGKDFQFDGSRLRRHETGTKTGDMFGKIFGEECNENVIIIGHELHTDTSRKKGLFGPPLQWGIVRLLVYPGEINTSEKYNWSNDVRMGGGVSKSTAHYGFNIAVPDLAEFYMFTHGLQKPQHCIEAIHSLSQQLRYNVVDEYRIDDSFTVKNQPPTIFE